MRDAGRRVCSLFEDFGIRAAGTAALTQITVPIRVLLLCGKFSSLLNPPHKQEQRDGTVTEMERFSTDPLLRPFSDPSLSPFCWSRNWVVINDSPSLILHLFTIDPEVKSYMALALQTAWISIDRRDLLFFPTACSFTASVSDRGSEESISEGVHL